MVPIDPNEPQSNRTDRVSRMFAQIAGRYDLLNTVVSLGMDRGWRKRTATRLELGPGDVVLDLACGTGPLARDIKALGASYLGLDISEPMMRHSPFEVPFLLGDCLALPARTGSLDGVTCAFALRHFVELEPLLREVGRVMRPGGRLALLELDIPTAAVLRWGHKLYCRSFLPLAGKLLAKQFAYEYLAESLASLPPHHELERQLGAAGFGDVTRHKLSWGIAQLVTATYGTDGDGS